MIKNPNNLGVVPHLKLLCITNQPAIAKVLESCGVDWIFVDLEVLGKQERQAGRNTVKSHHTIADVQSVSEVLEHSELLVRINPWGEHSVAEIEQVIAAGANIVMLPYFSRTDEVVSFVNAVAGRAKICLLLETPGAVEAIESIIKVPGIDHVHIGLNDLHMAYGMRFMFELLANGTVEKLIKIIGDHGISYGFGGCARVGQLIPPAENLLAEHYRLGSSSVILSRSFCNLDEMRTLDELDKNVRSGIQDIRDCWDEFKAREDAFFVQNREDIVRDIYQVVAQITENQVDDIKKEKIS